MSIDKNESQNPKSGFEINTDKTPIQASIENKGSSSTQIIKPVKKPSQDHLSDGRAYGHFFNWYDDL